MNQFADTVDPTRFREAMSLLAAGVSVVTSAGSDGTPYGLTATAVCSVSLEPPIVLACLASSSATHGTIVASNRFALNFLAQADADLAQRFSSSATDKFIGVEWRAGSEGSPILPGVLAVCQCLLERAVPVGDHTVFFGRVVNMEIPGGGPDDPLIYFKGLYQSLAESEET